MAVWEVGLMVVGKMRLSFLIKVYDNAPTPPDHVRVSPEADKLVERFVGFVGGIDNVKGAEGVDPIIPFVAKTTIWSPWTKSGVIPENVTDCVERELSVPETGLIIRPLRLKVYTVAPYPPSHVRSKPLSVRLETTRFTGSVGAMFIMIGNDGVEPVVFVAITTI